MTKKRNPKSKRVHDSDTGRFISEDNINSLTPFGYNEENDSVLSAGDLLVLLTFVASGLYVLGLLPF